MIRKSLGRPDRLGRRRGGVACDVHPGVDHKHSQAANASPGSLALSGSEIVGTRYRLAARRRCHYAGERTTRNDFAASSYFGIGVDHRVAVLSGEEDCHVRFYRGTGGRR